MVGYKAVNTYVTNRSFLIIVLLIHKKWGIFTSNCLFNFSPNTSPLPPPPISVCFKTLLFPWCFFFLSFTNCLFVVALLSTRCCLHFKLTLFMHLFQYLHEDSSCFLQVTMSGCTNNNSLAWVLHSQCSLQACYTNTLNGHRHVRTKLSCIVRCSLAAQLILLRSFSFQYI